MTDSIFLMTCAECEERGLPSRLWLRTSVEIKGRRASETHHYVECLNCGARLKNSHRDVMERVGDEEWRRCVGDDSGGRRETRPAAPGIR
jgi:Zn ribbon nucleic-acid-binding protein